MKKAWDGATAAIAAPEAAAAHPELKLDAKPLAKERDFRIWTDDFSNMFSILK